MAPSQALEFPCKITITTPFPTHRLASSAIRTLSVDQELSPLVHRTFELVSATQSQSGSQSNSLPQIQDSSASILKTTYAATTNRMLRVSVNGFFESLRVVLQVMEELDVDVIREAGLEGLEKVQGVEVGMTGTTVMGS